MKNIKKSLLFAMVLAMLIGFFQVLCLNKNVNAVDPVVKPTIDKDFLSYMSISEKGQTLTSSNISITDDGIYVIANDAVTINLQPFSTRYAYSTTENAYRDFYKKTTTIEIDRIFEDLTDDDKPDTSEDVPEGKKETTNKSFEYNGKTYYFELLTESRRNPTTGLIVKTEYLAFYNNPPISSSTSYIMTTRATEFITYTKTTEKYTINVVDSFSLKTESYTSTAKFDITVYKTLNDSRPTNYTLNLLKSVVRFANAENPIVEFSTYKNRDSETNAYNYEETDNWLQKEQTFSKVDISFLNNTYEYAEDNPLYFNINFNGFVYKYTLFAKNSKLYVRYVDEIKYNAASDEEKDKNIFELATDGNLKEIASDQRFSMIFTYRGRYFVEFYDSTYKLGFNTPNYYSTSFYVKDDTANTTNLFNNIYVLAETTDDEFNPIEYIVNGATLNNNVTASIKNLADFPSDDISISDIASRIDITYTEFGNSDNLPNTTRYYLRPQEDIDITKENNGKMVIVGRYYLNDFMEILENNNNEFINSFSSDGYYQIRIYKADELYTFIDNADPVEYNFTIVKQAKTTYTINGVIYSTDKPYYTDVRSYHQIIDNSDPIRFNVAFNDNVEEKETKLNISFQNDYKIIYGKQQVNLTFTENADEKTLVITCLGVGDMVVNVTFNDVTTTYNLNSENGNSTIAVTEYGTYTVSFSDSMGTATTGTFKYSKKMNISTIILISLSSFIAVAVIIFIISVRGKVKTR